MKRLIGRSSSKGVGPDLADGVAWAEAKIAEVEGSYPAAAG